MLHFTMTSGWNWTFCGAPRDNPDDTYAHVAYNAQAETEQLARPDLCPKCKALWMEYDNA